MYKPKKGATIFWYNHFVDEESGWLGPRDDLSFHGGCDVIKGIKWAANNWINAGKDRQKDMKVWREYAYLEELNKQDDDFRQEEDSEEHQENVEDNEEEKCQPPKN